MSTEGATKYINLRYPYPTSFLMRRKTFMDIGIDKNYLGSFWERDLSFELISRGGKVLIDSNSVLQEFNNDNSDDRLSLSCRGDAGYMMYVWTEEKQVKSPNEVSINFKYPPGNKLIECQLRNKRLVPIDPIIYTDDILKVSQGHNIPERWD